MISGITAPIPHFGRTGLLPASVKHFAMPDTLTGSGGQYFAEPLLYAARDDLSFLRSTMRGEVGRYRQSGSAHPGAFAPICHLIHGGRIYIGGRLLDDGNNARALLLVAEVGPNPVWKVVPTGLEGLKGSSGFRGIVGIAASGGQIAALSNTGELAVTENGDDWQAYPNLGFSGAFTANALAGGDAGFVAVGANGQAFTAPDARGTWTARASSFGTAVIFAALCIGTLFVIAGGARVATATGLGSFTARSVPAGTYLDKLMGMPGRIFAGGSSWLTSMDGTVWAAPADTPFKGETSRIRVGYKADDRWVVHWGNGRVSVSDDDTSWSEVASPKLPTQFWSPVAWAI